MPTPLEPKGQSWSGQCLCPPLSFCLKDLGVGRCPVVLAFCKKRKRAVYLMLTNKQSVPPDVVRIAAELLKYVDSVDVQKKDSKKGGIIDVKR